MTRTTSRSALPLVPTMFAILLTLGLTGAACDTDPHFDEADGVAPASAAACQPLEMDDSGRQLSCRGLKNCMRACEDASCTEQCEQKASALARAAYDRVERCLEARACLDDACAEQACAPELTACLPPRPALPACRKWAGWMAHGKAPDSLVPDATDPGLELTVQPQ
jgi:hypothetical protein